MNTVPSPDDEVDNDTVLGDAGRDAGVVLRPLDIRLCERSDANRAAQGAG